MKTHRPVFESEKPRIVKNLESAFKNALWDADKPFDINDNDMHLMFDATRILLAEDECRAKSNKFKK